MTRQNGITVLIVLTVSFYASLPTQAALRVNRIFSSNMVIQRDKPIVVWGWMDEGKEVTVTFGDEQKHATAGGKEGAWEVAFDAKPADATPHTLTVTSGEEKLVMENIVIGDIWVMWGQSNMAFGLGKTLEADMEMAQADLPLLRGIDISPSESQTERDDLREGAVGQWQVSSPQTAGGYSAIGYAFASRVQRATGIPIGMINNARGGASIESLVPKHMFDNDPVAAKYKAYIEQRIADWDETAWAEGAWKNAIARAKSRNIPEDKWPKKEDIKPRSWDIPGESPSDMASCYNGMFAPFKKLNIKGVLFHQGYNNAIGSNCRPKRYRILMKLMVEGIRKDFRDPDLAFGVIGLCAGGISQTQENFEVWSNSTQGYIREAQRLGLADVGDPDHTGYIPPDDIQIPGLHPAKKQAHGERAARWALQKIYGQKIKWDSADLVSSDREGDTLVLTFNKKVMPDDMSTIPEGFSIAGADGKYYKAYARYPLVNDVGIWNTANKSYDATKVIVWSPLVPDPVAVRYSWSASPLGNLRVNGQPWSPLHNFRTDSWDFPESDDPPESLFTREMGKAQAEDAQARNEFRRTEEAKLAVDILKRIQILGKPATE